MLRTYKSIGLVKNKGIESLFGVCLYGYPHFFTVDLSHGFLLLENGSTFATPCSTAVKHQDELWECIEDFVNPEEIFPTLSGYNCGSLQPDGFRSIAPGKNAVPLNKAMDCAAVSKCNDYTNKFLMWFDSSDDLLVEITPAETHSSALHCLTKSTRAGRCEKGTSHVWSANNQEEPYDIFSRKVDECIALLEKGKIPEEPHQKPSLRTKICSFGLRIIRGIKDAIFSVQCGTSIVHGKDSAALHQQKLQQKLHQRLAKLGRQKQVLQSTGQHKINSIRTKLVRGGACFDNARSSWKAWLSSWLHLAIHTAVFWLMQGFQYLFSLPPLQRDQPVLTRKEQRALKKAVHRYERSAQTICSEAADAVCAWHHWAQCQPNYPRKLVPWKEGLHYVGWITLHLLQTSAVDVLLLLMAPLLVAWQPLLKLGVTLQQSINRSNGKITEAKSGELPCTSSIQDWLVEAWLEAKYSRLCYMNERQLQQEFLATGKLRSNGGGQKVMRRRLRRHYREVARLLLLPNYSSKEGITLPKETAAVKQVFVNTGSSTLALTVRDDLSDTIDAIKEKVVASHLFCDSKDLRLNYQGKEILNGTLQSNHIGNQATLFAVGRLPGGGRGRKPKTPGKPMTGAERMANMRANQSQEAKDANKAERRKKYRQKHPPKQPVSAAERQQNHRYNLPQEEKNASNAQRREARARLPQEEQHAINTQRREARTSLPQEEQDAVNAQRREDRRQAKESAQQLIRENRASFSATEITSETKFDGFEHHPETAVMLYLLNSGANKFRKLDDIDFDADEIDKDLLEQLAAEIKEEVLTEEELQTITQQYCQAQGRGMEGVNHSIDGLPETKDAYILSCGACGYRHPHRGRSSFSKVPLQSLLGTPIEYQPEQKEAWKEEKKQPPLVLPYNANGDLQEYHISKLRSAYDSEALGTTFHLHPELVDREPGDGGSEFTFFCQSCYDACCKPSAAQAPSNSIASGVDLGDANRIGLPKPTVSELALIARIRHYHNVVKIQSNKTVGCLTNHTVSKIRGHSIAFRHTAPIVCALAMLLNQIQNGVTEKSKVADLLTEALTIQLLGSSGKEDDIARTANKVLSARPFVIYTWLSVLHKTHALYKDDPPLPDFSEFRSIIEECNSKLFKEAEHIRDKEVLNAEKTIGDDVSGVRASVMERGDAVQDRTGRQEDDDPALSFTYIVDEQQHINNLTNKLRDRENAEDAADSLEELALVFNINLKEKIKKWRENQELLWQSEREEDPLSEFDNMEELLVGGYPHVFLYGRCYGPSSREGWAPCKQEPQQQQPQQQQQSQQEQQQRFRLHSNHIRHLLLHFSTCAAMDHQLLFYLFDYQMRHSFMKNLHVKIKKDPAAFSEYAEMLCSQEWRDKIEVAGNDPTSKSAQEVLAAVLPVLKFGGGENNIMGSIGHSTSFSRSMALMKRYGPASVFLTITPNDVSNPTSFRLTHRSTSNSSFPATGTEDFLRHMQSDEEVYNEQDAKTGVEIPIPCDYTARVQAAAGNPVAVALEYQAMIENVMSKLVGVKINFEHSNDSKTVKTWYFKGKEPNSARRKGIFGHVTAFFGVTETQQRGALHFHCLLYGGLTPKLLERAASVPELSVAVGNALNTMYTAELPRSFHVRDHFAKVMKNNYRKGAKENCKVPYTPPPVTCTPPLPSTATREEWKKFFWETVLKHGLHLHTNSCKKPPGGKHGCRFAKESGLKEMTGPVQLLEPEDELDKGTPRQNAGVRKLKEKKMPIVKEEVDPPETENLRDRNYATHPIPSLDDRILVWELQRPLIDPLPDIPHLSQDQVECLLADGATAHPELACELAPAKAFCIEEIDRAVRPHNPEEISASIRRWLQSIEPVSVISVYQELNGQLPMRNGLVTETNDTLANLTGSSSNAILLGNTQQAKAALYYV